MQIKILNVNINNVCLYKYLKYYKNEMLSDYVLLLYIFETVIKFP